MSLIPFSVAAILFIIAFSNKRAADTKAKTWVNVRGKVVEIKNFWTNRKKYAPIVAFVSANGQQIYFEGKGHQRSFYQVGQVIDVAYHPLDPHRAEVKHDPGDAEIRNWRFIVGGFFLLCAIPMLFIDLLIVVSGLMSVFRN